MFENQSFGDGTLCDTNSFRFSLMLSALFCFWKPDAKVPKTWSDVPNEKGCRMADERVHKERAVQSRRNNAECRSYSARRRHKVGTKSVTSERTRLDDVTGCCARASRETEKDSATAVTQTAIDCGLCSVLSRHPSAK